jgi:hypothetical protein
MKAKELAAMLLETPDHEVYLSVDAEGNDYKQLDDLELSTIEEIDENSDSETGCVVLYPV